MNQRAIALWGKNEYVNEAKSIMDRLLIEDAEENN